MSNTKKFSLLLIGAVVIGSIFVYYRYAKLALQSTEESMVVPAANTRSAVITYDAYEGKMDTLRFVVTLDSTGAIETIQTLDAATGEVPEKKKEFNQLVNVQLKGKKLSELKSIDKVGESSKTTEAFNRAIPELQKGM